MKILHETVLNAVDASQTHTSDHFSLEGIYCFSVQANYSGTPSGTVQIQGSNDWIEPGKTQPRPVTWAAIGSATTMDAASKMINLDGQGYAWGRVVFTANAGTGTITTKVFGKGA